MSANTNETAGIKAPKMGWLERAMARIGMGETGKVNAFRNKLVSEWTKTIRDRKRKIVACETQLSDDLQILDEKMVDLKEALEDAFLVVDPTMIETSSDREDYVLVVTSNLIRCEKAIESHNDEVNRKKEACKKMVDAYNVEIARLERFMEVYAD